MRTRKQRAANLPDFVAWDDFRDGAFAQPDAAPDAIEEIDADRVAATEALMDAILLSEMADAPAG